MPTCRLSSCVKNVPPRNSDLSAPILRDPQPRRDVPDQGSAVLLRVLAVLILRRVQIEIRARLGRERRRRVLPAPLALDVRVAQLAVGVGLGRGRGVQEDRLRGELRVVVGGAAGGTRGSRGLPSASRSGTGSMLHEP